MSHTMNYNEQLLRMCGQQTTSNKKMLAKPGPEAIITPSGGLVSLRTYSNTL